MSLFKRWFKGTPQPPAASSFSPEACLVSAGWQAGRSCDLAAVEPVLAQAGFTLHEAARRFLGEYYGLRVDVPIAGADVPIQRVPSGLLTPGGTGPRPAAHGESGGNQVGFFCFSITW